MYACMYICIICHIKIFTSYYNKYRKYIQYNILRLKFKRKTPLITVAGIALKGQADLISIMVPLEVLV